MSVKLVINELLMYTSYWFDLQLLGFVLQRNVKRSDEMCFFGLFVVDKTYYAYQYTYGMVRPCLSAAECVKTYMV